MKLSGISLTCQRGERTVFTGVSFTLASGEGLLLTGPNGSGKTSLLRLVAGLLSPAEGQLELEGGSPDLAIGQHAHFIGHLDAVKTALTVEENLAFWRDFLGGGDVGAALEAFGLSHLGDVPAGLLSAGQKRRLSLSRLALVPRPIWLLDEPSVSLDRESVTRLAGLVAHHVAEGGMVAASTHSELGIDFAHTLTFGNGGAS